MATLYTHHTGFSSSPSLPIHHPSTPPYTPLRSKASRPFSSRAASPASFTSSIHPTEQESPAKKGAQRLASLANSNDFQIEEIEDSDIGYHTDVDIVYPQELEERDSDGADSDVSGDSDGEDEEEMDGGIAGRMASMRCDDDESGESGEAADQSRHRGLKQRTGSRIFKRSHSQSMTGEHSDAADTDAMCDQDLDASARRLRRRVRGPPTSAPITVTPPPGSTPSARRFSPLRTDVSRGSPDSFRTAAESRPISGHASPRAGFPSVNMVDDDSDDDDHDELAARIRNGKGQNMDVDDDHDSD
ncbi:hypothetical protein K431DRAFT_301086 [Polychaeton citri CBS 116435]|uniref:Uncharacterized protein n=1 Tax=Polychaeton citri CBS 116435 TaxID=1314669 RepID=A0A9P4QGD1_9PEZI|nr:hypothetical protein K431DRAFT_301086 [Polychaeton citri CBS 116435]